MTQQFRFVFQKISRIAAGVLLVCMLTRPVVSAAEPSSTTPPKESAGITLSCEAAVLMEGSTGKIIYSKNAEKELRPASITKIMTLLLIFEAIEEGKISLTDMVPVSEHAAGMGGSQVYLEPYETQDVNTMIKCISIASANDASVAMAEFIAGSEEAFVKRMNERAAELGMTHTHFINCYGLDTDGHYSSALDVAKMSRELIVNHPQISNYSTVWMDTFVHTTKKGQTEFGLTNTNKLIRSYEGITGLKTGSTGLAKYCLSATARRNDMDLIAVIMAAPDTKTRFAEAATLLNYGFANCSIYQDRGENFDFTPVKVRGGVLDEVLPIAKDTFSYVCINGVIPSEISRRLEVLEEVQAPVTKDTILGSIIYERGEEELGRLDLYAVQEVEKAGYLDCLDQVLHEYLY